MQKTICRANFASVRIVTSLSGLAYEQIILHSKFCRFINPILKQEHAVSYPSPPYVYGSYTCLRTTGKGRRKYVRADTVKDLEYTA